MRGMLSFRDRFRRGRLHQRLPARAARGALRRQAAGQVKQEVSGGLQEGAVRRQRAQDAQARRAGCSGTRPRACGSPTASATATPTRTPSARTSSCARWPARRHWDLVWDIGANNGRYSRIAAEGASTVVAVDADQGPVELLYRDLSDEGDESILTLTMNLADPSPGLGWRGLERRRWTTAASRTWCWLWPWCTTWRSPPTCRCRSSWIGWPRWARSLVIEFPTREDPMVQAAARAQARGPASRLRAEFFERCWREAFEVERSRAPPVGHARALLRAAQRRG